MEIYVILALSFAIMYHINYTNEILAVVKDVAVIHDAEATAPLFIYGIVSFLTTLVFMPGYVLQILLKSRDDIIRSVSSEVLVKFYDLEPKK